MLTLSTSSSNSASVPSQSVTIDEDVFLVFLFCAILASSSFSIALRRFVSIIVGGIVGVSCSFTSLPLDLDEVSVLAIKLSKYFTIASSCCCQMRPPLQAVSSSSETPSHTKHEPLLTHSALYWLNPQESRPIASSAVIRVSIKLISVSRGSSPTLTLHVFLRYLSIAGDDDTNSRNSTDLCKLSRRTATSLGVKRLSTSFRLSFSKSLISFSESRMLFHIPSSRQASVIS